MPNIGFKGISFPFRIGPQGGCVMTTTSVSNPTHILESIQQIFGTDYLQRVMEPDIYSTVTPMLFEPNDESLQNVLKSRIVSDLERLEPRIEVSEDDIEFSVDDSGEISVLYTTVTFKIIKYETWYTNTFKVGEVVNE